MVLFASRPTALKSRVFIVVLPPVFNGSRVEESQWENKVVGRGGIAEGEMWREGDGREDDGEEDEEEEEGFLALGADDEEVDAEEEEDEEEEG